MIAIDFDGVEKALVHLLTESALFQRAAWGNDTACLNLAIG